MIAKLRRLESPCQSFSAFVRARPGRPGGLPHRSSFSCPGLALLGLLSGLLAGPVRAELALDADPSLRSLLEQALEHHPAPGAVASQIDAAKARVSQDAALPDPSLSLGIQNDGFQGLRIGEMETSYFSLMASQTLPWPGRLELRRQGAQLEVQRLEPVARRVRLSLEAEVRRTWLELVLVRDRLRLFADQQALWKRAEEVTRVRYKVGGGAQADLLRTQLELARLQQQRSGLEAEERILLARLNRLRVQPLDAPIETPVHLTELGDPLLARQEDAVAWAEAQSPELAQARTRRAQRAQDVALARHRLRPDLVLGAGIMPRGGLEPMWQLSIGSTLPVFAAKKQQQGIAEALAGERQEMLEEEQLRQTLYLRVQERQERLRSLLEVNRLYRDGVLVLSDAATQASLAQYAVGQVPFATVLETLNGHLQDHERYLESVVRTWQVAIEAEELSLEGPQGLEAAESGASIPNPSRQTPAGAGSTGSSGSGMKM